MRFGGAKSADVAFTQPIITQLIPSHGVFKGLSRATKWCTPKNYIFWNLLCMLVNVGGAKEIRKFGQHLQPGHYCALGWPGFAPTFMDQVHPPTVVASMQVMPKKHFFAILSSAVLELNPNRYQNTMHV